MPTGITLSDDFNAFLDERIDRDDADAIIAEHFMTANVPTEIVNPEAIDEPIRERPSTDAHDFFDLHAVDGAPRITYTTRAKYERACIAGFSGHPFTPGVGWRIAAKPAAVAQRVTKLDATDYGRAYDVFTQACAARLIAPIDAGIEIVSGEDITHHYAKRNHCSCGRNLGDLADSCMRYAKCEGRFGIYEDNADMAVLRCPECGGTRGRALLWTDQDECQWIDRVYAGPRDTEVMKAWASAEGYRALWSDASHGAISRPVYVSAPSVDYSSAPYLDSLIYWCRTCETLSNNPCGERGHWEVTLRDYVYGTNHHGWEPPCAECGGLIGHTGHCRNADLCPGCHEWFCAVAGVCPNDCQPCPGCGDILAACDVCESCYHCECGQTQSSADVGRNLGRCLCGEVLEPAWTDYRPVALTWDRYSDGRGYTSLYGTCPDCCAGHQACRSPDGRLDLSGTNTNAASGEGTCYSCHRPIRWEVPDLRPATLPPTVPGWSPGRMRASVRALKAAAIRRLTCDQWRLLMNVGDIALYATYADQPATDRLDARGGAVTGCDCHSCQRVRRTYDERTR